MTDLIAKHGGYENLKSYQMATLVYDLTVEFCARFVDTRNKTNKTDRTDETYESYMSDSEKAANLLICLVNQTNYLLDQQLRSLEKELLKFGDLKERYKSSRSYKVNLMRQQKEDDEWLAEQSKRIKSESNKSLPAQAGNKSD